MKRLVALWIGLLLLLGGLPSFAGDPEYCFMRNDHDCLVLGEIIASDDNYVEIEPHWFFVSSKDMYENQKRVQLRPHKVLLKKDTYMDYRTGDYILTDLYLEQAPDIFKVAKAHYKVNSLNYKTADGESLPPEIKSFINQAVLVTDSSGVPKQSEPPIATAYPASYQEPKPDSLWDNPLIHVWIAILLILCIAPFVLINVTRRKQRRV